MFVPFSSPSTKIKKKFLEIFAFPVGNEVECSRSEMIVAS